MLHCVGGCGGCHRKAPTGGAAYGMPSHSLTPVAVVLVIPHTGPEAVGTVVPAAHVPVVALAALVAGPAEAIAMTPTVRAATANTDPNSRDRHRRNLMNLMIPRFPNYLRRVVAGAENASSPCLTEATAG